MTTERNMMKRATSLSLAGAILAMTFFVIACSTSSGIDRSEKAGSTMGEVEKNINQLIAQVQATDASLEELIKADQSNAKKAFKKYSKNVNTVEKQGVNLSKQAEKMSTLGKDYFEEWRASDATYNNSQIQALSEQRRADLAADFANISEASVGVRGAIKSYIANNKEIQTYLSNDLTPVGIASIAPIAEKSIDDGNSIKAAVKPILAAIANAKDKIKISGSN